MHTALYVVWFILPAFFFLVALWAKLEALSGKTKREKPGDFVKNGFFVLACVLLAVLIDTYFLEHLVDNLVPFLPLALFQILLLPFILLVAAKLLGGSKEIRISKAPRTSQRKKR